jgi:hypothetical protein
MATIALDIGGRIFSTKSAATSYFRKMLGKYELGNWVDSDDRRMLAELLIRHRYSNDLLRDPISGFRITKDALTGHRRFEIVRPDGTVNDFSYLKCISPPHDRHFEDVIWAMRCKVIKQTRFFHNSAFKGQSTVQCGITSVRIGRKSSHVDHVPPLTFRVIAFNFLKTVGLKVQDVFITSEGHLHASSARYLADRALATKWQEYHLKHAVLRITSKAANFAQKKTKIDFSSLA